MYIHQFYNPTISHASYAILIENIVVLVDPGRDPKQYYDFATEHNAEILYVLETHPHADFVSSHLQIHKETGATIGINSLAGSTYPHVGFNHNDKLVLGTVNITTLHTPGHSPDSNSYLFTETNTNEQALFSGDFLFIGDVGRPDLREHVGNIQEVRSSLAEKMYTTIHTVIPELSDDVVIYPTHGAGSLCGKNLSSELSDTLGNQRKNNWALQNITKESFVAQLLEDQPYIPKYFSECVMINRSGADDYIADSAIHFFSFEEVSKLNNFLVVDTRQSEVYGLGSYKGAVNIPAGETDKFETWLGTILSPDESYVLIVDSKKDAKNIEKRLYTIGYEKNLLGYYLADDNLNHVNVKIFDAHNIDHHIIDIRQEHEHHERKAFEHAQNIPLSILRESLNTIQTDLPIVIHCAGGYRSAIGASIVASTYPEIEVYDMSINIKKHLS